MDGIQVLRTGPEPLQNDQCKAILVLRLGAALNSLRAVQRWTDKLNGNEPADQLDRVQAYVIASAYLAEACKLFWLNQTCVVELAKQGGAQERAIDILLSIANPETGTRANLLRWIRDKEAFHWDCDVFEQWASQKRGQVTWFKTIGGTVAGSVMWASHEAVVHYTLSLADKTKPPREQIDDQVKEVVEASKHVSDVFEYAVNGFLKAHGAKLENEQPDPPA